MITALGPSAKSRRRGIARAATALLAAGALALTACSSAGESSSPAGVQEAPELKKMLVVTFLPLESWSFTPAYLAY